MLKTLKRLWGRVFTPLDELRDPRGAAFSSLTQDDRVRAAMEEHYRRRNPPPPPDAIVAQIDWMQAPEGYHLWRYDDQKKIAVWMNGKSTIEEYGEVWDVVVAPTFGATELMQMQMPSLEQKRRKAVVNEEQLEQTLPQVLEAPGASSKPRL